MSLMGSGQGGVLPMALPGILPQMPGDMPSLLGGIQMPVSGESSAGDVEVDMNDADFMMYRFKVK